MRTPGLILFCGLLFGSAAAQPSGGPPCAAEAGKAALKLLVLHTDAGDRAGIDKERIRKIGTVKALVGNRLLDVLEVQGFVYKANYRIRLIYAQIPGSCALMGQEILERSDPY